MTLLAALLRASIMIGLPLAGIAGMAPVHAQAPTPADGQPARIAKGDIPAWLAERALPEPTAAQLVRARGGAAYLLTDWQVRGSDTGHQSYYRVASKVVERSGLEDAGKIEIDFDPRFETATLNFVRIVRDGKVIDRTAEAAFTIVEREDRLDEEIISGQLRAIAHLKDVRVGDVVDYAVTHDVRSTLWPGHYFNALTARYSVPLSQRNVRILWPHARPLQFRPRNTTIGFTSRREGDMQLWEWIGTDPPFEQDEKDVPSWYPQYGSVDISTMARWSEVVDWAVPHYAGDVSLPADFAAKLDAIAARWPRPEDRLTEATRLVQDTIRYVGEEMGEGSYVPRRPALVVERGYGDCKDKALLLAVALRRLGIDAVPALVSTRPGYDLTERLPSPLAFDHVVVRAALGGQVTWIDATASYQGGRGLALVPASFGYALPIRAGQTALEEMKGRGERAGAMVVVERFAVDEAAATALTLAVETRYTGGQADYARSRNASQPVADQARANLEFYQKRFPGLVESVPLAIRDDRDGNVVTMVETYTLSKAAFEKGKILADLVTSAYTVADILPARQSGARRNPLVLPRNLTREQTIELVVKGRPAVLPDDIDMQAGGVSFVRTSTVTGETLKMVYRLSSGAGGSVPATGAEGVFALSDKIGEESGLTFHFDRVEKSAGKSGVAARAEGEPDPAMLAPWKEQLDRAGTLMVAPDQPSRIEALSILNAVSAKVPRPSPAAGIVDGTKGIVLAGLGRFAAARTALQSSVEQYQGRPEFFRMLMAVQLDGRDPSGFVKTLKLTVEHHPDEVARIEPDWLRSSFWPQLQGLKPAERKRLREEACTMLAGAGWRQQPATEEGESMVGCAVKVALDRGDVPGARALLARGLAVDALVDLAIDRRYQALWPDIDRVRGNGFRAPIETAVAKAAAAAKAAPDDFDAVLRHVRALRLAGDPAAAVAAGKRLAEDRARIEATGGQAFWLVNDYAYALVDAGRTDDAVAAMDAIIALGLETYPHLVSQIINQSETLMEAGRFDRALAVLAMVEGEETPVSGYGRMWILATKACSLRELGRAGEAAVLEAKLVAETNQPAAAMAAACRGDVAAIEAQLVARLDDPDERAAALAGFILFKRSSPNTPFKAKLAKVMETVRARPQVKARLERYGRAIDVDGAGTYWGSF
ncbi:DUF3857 domain-containing protein [Sphingomonas sanxanigenens]|uniref:DUF3857 domain-containing protein n=1 Tax=Sphingomonas sanxanigenens DSM 19645 = NX02 TaxID=1123269 RepID=W0AA39_9SPHN|nr:DUF3857 domain-containing protein [Sphingomonas sanxanigenens]AHE52515.1 hypothetical protein NX02_03805 [Sphingomonas sanxanigenens DSM 19645 = NX02]